jgi:CHAT domain-containing protein
MGPRSTRLNAVRWLIAIAIAAMTGLSMTHRRPDLLQQLVAAAAQCNLRPIEARLSEFPYAGRPATRSGDDSPNALVRLRGAAAEMLDSCAGRDQYVVGVSELIAGNPVTASETLERVARTSNDARSWNDLAAARMEMARQHDIPELIAQALADALEAIELDPDYLPAYFNRALALDALHINPAAERAYLDYLSRDASSQWANEARQRLSSVPRSTAAAEWAQERPRLERVCRDGDHAAATAIVRKFPQQARKWGEGPYLSDWADNTDRNPALAAQSLAVARCVGGALQAVSGERLLLDAVLAVDRQSHRALLSRAHAAYRGGRLAYRDGDQQTAARLFEQAATTFEAAQSPMTFVAAFYRACTVVDSGDSSGGLALLDSLASRLAPSYLALRAQIEYERGLALGRLGRVYEGTDATREALRRFEALNETENATRMRTNLLAALTFGGASTEAWRMRRTVFAEASASGTPDALEQALLGAVYDEMIERRWEIAGALATELSKFELQSQLFRAETLLWRSFARGRTAAAVDPATFGPAHAAAGAIRDPDLREEVLDKIHLAEADLFAEREPSRARRFADAAIEYRRHRFPYLLPAAYVVRARAFRALGDVGSATADLDLAIDAIEQQRRTLRDDISRDSYIGGDVRMFDEALELAASSADYDRMFRIAEHSSARLITARLGADPPARSLQELPARVPGGTTVLHFTTLRDYSIGIGINAHGVRVVKIAAGRGALSAQRDQFLASIADDTSAYELACALHDEFLAPFAAEIAGASSLVIVTDETLAPIPFAALADRATGRFVIDDRAVSHAPTVGTWIVRHTEAHGQNHGRAVIAGDPALDVQRFPSLPRLVAARGEVAAIARMYGDSESLLGEDATRERLLASMPDADVIHIAAHAVVNGRDASRSVIPLTPIAHDAGLLSVQDVTRLRLQRSPVVVLAGCRTAVEAAGHGSTTSFALAFLAAGSRAVAATLWNVDDEAARDFSVSFHRDLGAGITPSEAVRRAQLRLLQARGRDRLREWAGFQLCGYE